MSSDCPMLSDSLPRYQAVCPAGRAFADGRTCHGRGHNRRIKSLQLGGESGDRDLCITGSGQCCSWSDLASHTTDRDRGVHEDEHMIMESIASTCRCSGSWNQVVADAWNRWHSILNQPLKASEDRTTGCSLTAGPSLCICLPRQAGPRMTSKVGFQLRSSHPCAVDYTAVMLAVGNPSRYVFAIWNPVLCVCRSLGDQREHRTLSQRQTGDDPGEHACMTHVLACSARCNEADFKNLPQVRCTILDLSHSLRSHLVGLLLLHEPFEG